MLDQCLLTAHEALVLHGYGFVPRKSKPKVEDSVLLSSYNIYMRNLIITTKKEDEALFTSPEDTYPKILRREFLSCWNNVQHVVLTQCTVEYLYKLYCSVIMWFYFRGF